MGLGLGLFEDLSFAFRNWVPVGLGGWGGLSPGGGGSSVMNGTLGLLRIGTSCFLSPCSDFVFPMEWSRGGLGWTAGLGEEETLGGVGGGRSGVEGLLSSLREESLPERRSNFFSLLWSSFDLNLTLTIFGEGGCWTLSSMSSESELIGLV